MKRFMSAFLAFILCFSASAVGFAETVDVSFSPDEQTEDSSSSPLSYVVLGDSIARGAGLWNPEEAVYGKIVADTDGFEYHNFGIDGFRSVDLAALLQRKDVAETVKNADIISISIGGNDFLKGNLPRLILSTLVGNRGPLNEIIDNFYLNFCTVIEEIKILNPDAVILTQTLYNTGGYIIFYPVFEIALRQFNDCFYRYQRENPDSIEIVDIYSAFRFKGINICGDTIHPNGSGNKIIAREILKKLNELGLGDKTEPVINAEPVTTISVNPVNFVYLIILLLNKIIAVT